MHNYALGGAAFDQEIKLAYMVAGDPLARQRLRAGSSRGRSEGPDSSSSQQMVSNQDNAVRPSLQLPCTLKPLGQ